MFALALQVVLTLPPCPAPVRFGLPLPIEQVQQGLCVRGRGKVQLRRLGLIAGPDLVWAEVAVAEAKGAVRLVPAKGRGEPGVEVYRLQRSADGTAEWSWCDGTTDRRTRRRVERLEHSGGERWQVGEWETVESAALSRRWLVVTSLPRRLWQRAGLLPRRLGAEQQGLRHLRAVARALVEMPGRRGAGDYARSGGVVTNLEFDMPLAFLRLGLACKDAGLLERARRSAWHLVDRDLDQASGLPFAHGVGHRHSAPSLGHTWLSGLLWVGALTADEGLMDAARQIAGAVAGETATSRGEVERARDYGWPLWEMETYLRMLPDPVVAAAADRTARALHARFDRRLGTFRFGEGEAGPGQYLERAWITGGIVLPALRTHLRRRPDPVLQAVVDEVADDLLRTCLQGGPGVATHWRLADGRPFGLYHARQDPKVWMMLEGLGIDGRARLLQKGRVKRSMLATPDPEHPDRATHLAMIARNLWVYSGCL
ncbi:MAG: hypothetical protein VYE77_11600 [Planctomycetota bacterium]|nr:hypothetical protein [Planctomycetota bacterium]